MGKATRFLKALFGFKRLKENGETPPGSEKKGKKRWSFVKPGKDPAGSGRLQADPDSDSAAWLRSFVSDSSSLEQSKHAIAVAAATAAAADAAVAAAQAAAAAVARLKIHDEEARFAGGRERFAAVKIQTVFRGFLARKALRALKALVKLQAVVRGYLVRKRAAATLYSMQALIRAQATTRARRVCNYPPELRVKGTMDNATSNGSHSKRLDPGLIESPKIVQIDTCKSRSRRMSNAAMHISTDHRFCYNTMSSPLPCPIPTVQSSIPDCGWGFVPEDYYKFATAQNTPRLSHSDRIIINSPMTPAKSVSCGESFLSYNYPNYMTNTESFRAKVRSQSAPRQRLLVTEAMSRRSSFSGVRMQQQQRSSRCQVQQDFS